tara:strand:+ start:1758 stop:2264 length:507 start_codon:yes stop_codon:yes gene_type:complete
MANKINFYNGRVINLDKIAYKSMNLTETNPKTDNKDFDSKAVSNIQQSTNLSNLFFSEQNINNLQNKIRYDIFKLTNKTIHRQSDIELKIVMRSYYLQYGKNNPNNLNKQVDELNNLVLGYCVPKIQDELQQHLDYIKDVQNLPMPLERPLNMSSAGTKYLKSVTNTF